MREPEQPALFADVGLRQKFARVMLELETAFGRKPSSARVDVYWRYLHTLDMDWLHRAAVEQIEDVGRFPSIADWRKAAKKHGAKKARKRGAFTRVEGIYCDQCEDAGVRLWEGTEKSKGEAISVQQWRDREPGWIYRVGPCPCRDHNPNYQVAMDEKTSNPPDIDRNKAKQMMARYVGGRTGQW